MQRLKVRARRGDGTFFERAQEIEFKAGVYGFVAMGAANVTSRCLKGV